MTLADFCAATRNWFVFFAINGTFRAEQGRISVLDRYLQEGQYFRVLGGVFNTDGIFQYHTEGDLGIKSEIFTGAIIAMNVPQDVLTLIDRINAWEAENATVINGPFQSESYAGYSYTKASGDADSDGSSITWQSQFKKELNRWRKI